MSGLSGMDTETLKKWAEELHKRERQLLEREKELETKIKRQTITDGAALGHSSSTTNLNMSKDDKNSGREKPQTFSGSARFKSQGSRKPYRLQPLAEKNGPANGKDDLGNSTATSIVASQQPQQPAPIQISQQQHSTNVTQSTAKGESRGQLTYSKITAKVQKSMKSLALQEAVSDKQVADALSGMYFMIKYAFLIDNMVYIFFVNIYCFSVAFNTVDKDHNGVIDSYEVLLKVNDVTLSHSLISVV